MPKKNHSNLLELKYKQLSDSQLLDLIQKENNIAFQALFDRHWKSLLSSALKVLNNEQAAEDVVQELFIDLWNRRKQLEIQNLKGYLHTAIRYQTAKVISKTEFTVDHEEALEQIETYLRPEAHLQLDDLKKQIENSLEQLTFREKEIFIQSRFQNLSNQEIAERNGISIRTVENHLTSALAEIRNTLKNQYTLNAIVVMYLFM